MANQVEVTITASDDTKTGISRAQAAFDKFGKNVRSSLDSASSAVDDLANNTQGMSRLEGSFDKVGKTALGMNATLETSTAALEGIDAIQNGAAREATRLARAQQDVQHAMSDADQAAQDLLQAQQDLTQAQNDGRQAGQDLKQAKIDQKQADLDAAKAQKEYNEAVKKFGKGSDEAKQASIDLEQAKADSSQASLDLKQAEADATQATLDGKQATKDARDANIAAKDAQLDLNEAQKAVDPGPVQKAMAAIQTYGSVIAGAAIVMQTLNVATMKNTVSTVAGKVASTAAAGASKALAAGQWLVNAAMSANPIGIVVVALAALAAGLVYAYKNSKTFRVFVQQAFDLVSAGAANMAGLLLKGFKAIVGSWLSTAGAILNGAVLAFGWIPGIGDKLRGAQKAFGAFKDGVNQKFDEMIRKTGQWERSAGQAFRTRKLNADISDWQSKINKAKADLKSVPASKRAKVLSDIKDLQNKVAKAKRELASIKDEKVYLTTYVQRVNQGYAGNSATGGKRTGGPIGAAASGGVRGNMTLVGEEGPELVNLPGGSFVHTAGATNRMLGQGNSGGTIQIEWVGSNAGDEFMTWLKKNIRIRGGSGPGSVQTALGR